MAFPGIPEFPTGLMMQDGTQMQAFVHNTLSVDIALRAHQGGGQQFATLVDSVVNVISRVTSVGDSIQLPPTNGRRGLGPFLGGLQILIINSQTNACQLFGNFFENCTIGGIAGTTGISIPGGASIQLCCGAVGIWISIVGAAGGGIPFTGGQLTGDLGFLTQQGIVGAGTTSQTNSTLITSQVAIISSFPSSGVSGVRLPALADVTGIPGPIWLKNKDPSNNGLVYPPIGGQIDFYGVNSPILLSSLDELNIVPGTVTGQWWS